MKKLLLFIGIFLILFVKPSYATWWDTDWSNCKNITLSETRILNRTLEPVKVNLTSLTFGSINEIRIVGTGCGNGGIEIPRDIISNTTSSAYVIFLANYSTVGDNNYSVYYNSVGASAPSYASTILMVNNSSQINVTVSGQYTMIYDKDDARSDRADATQDCGMFYLRYANDTTIWGHYHADDWAFPANPGGCVLTVNFNGSVMTSFNVTNTTTGRNEIVECYDKNGYCLLNYIHNATAAYGWYSTYPDQGSTAFSWTVPNKWTGPATSGQEPVSMSYIINESFWYIGIVNKTSINNANTMRSDGWGWYTDVRTGTTGGTSPSFEAFFLMNYRNNSNSNSTITKLKNPLSTALGAEESAPAVDTPPTYSLNSTNSTTVGTPVSHNLYWEDDVGLSYYLFSFDNCTGDLANDTTSEIFNHDFNQTETTNITGYNTTSPDYLNVLDGQTYNVTEAVVASGEAQTYNWTSSDQEPGTQRFNTSATLNTYNTGWVNGTAVYTVAGSAWTNPTRVYTPNDAYAQQNADKLNILGLNITNTIPAGATILGIGIATRANASSASGTNQIYFQVSNNSGVTWSKTLKTTGDISTTNTYRYYGNTSFLWGLTWDGVDGANNLRISANGSDSSTSYYVRLDWFAANVTYSNWTAKTEQNSSWTSVYDGIDGDDFQNMDKVGIIITINTYNPSASNDTYGNTIRPDIEVGFYNGTAYVNNSYCQANNTMGMNLLNTTAWNCSINTTDTQFLNAWKYQANRSVIIRGRWLDAYNSTIYDEVNVTGVYGYVDGWNSTISNYSAEIEHNATLDYPGQLLNITATVNFTSSVTSVFNLTIFNFATGTWDYSLCSNGEVTADTWYSWTCNVTTNVLNYNSSDNKVRIRLNETEHSSQGLIMEDYVHYKTYSNATKDDWIAFSGAKGPMGAWSNVTKIINSTEECTIRWCVYANDTSNNWNRTSCDAPFSYLTISEDTTPPNITFISQEPADIDTINILGRDLNITYNISDVSGISNVNFSYKTNTTTEDKFIYINGTPISGYQIATEMSNVSDIWNFTMQDNEIYPATYNFNETVMRVTPREYYDLDANNEYIKIRLFNTTNLRNYSFFEINVINQTPDSRTLRIYYCNESYGIGNPISSSNCINFYNLPAGVVNHSHSNYSNHSVIPFAINLSTGMIGDVYVTNTSYFLLRGRQGADAWNISYVTNVSRVDTIQTSTNAGGAWANFTGTIDAHLHQYNGSDTFYYYVCANDTLGNSNCSTVRYDLIDLAGLPPIAPEVYNPIEGFYTGDIIINYTASLSPNSYPIEFYNISLVNVDETFNISIISNNYLNLSYVWDSTATPNDEYVIRVEACDNLGQCSFGYSENITIYSVFPKSISDYFSLSNIMGRLRTAPERVYQSLNINTMISRLLNLIRGIPQSINFNTMIKTYGIRISRIAQSIGVNTMAGRLKTAFGKTFQSISINTFITRVYSGFKSVPQNIIINTIAGRLRSMLGSVGQSISLSTIISRMGSLIQRITQSIGINTMITRIGFITNKIAQSIIITTVSDRLRTSFRIVGQNLNINTFVDRLFSGIRIISQQISINTAIGRLRSMLANVSQNININTIVGRLEKLIRATSQQISFSTSISEFLKGIRKVSEQITVSTMIGRLRNILTSATQSINISTMISRVLSAIRLISQQIIINTIADRLRSMLEPISQSMNMNIVTQRVLIALRKIPENININTILQGVGKLVRFAYQQMTINTMVGRLRNVPKIVSQSISINTMTSKLLKGIRSITQSISISTMMSRLRNVVRTSSQNISFNTMTSRILGIIRSISQSISVNTMMSRLLFVVRSVGQQIFINTYALGQRMGLFANIGQQISINTVIRRFYSGTQRIGEQISISISIQRIRGILRVVSNSISINTVVKRISYGIRLISQNISINTAISNFIKRIASVSQQINVNSVVQRMAAIFKTVSQQISINSIINRIRGVSRLITEQISVNTVVQRMGLLLRSVSQQVNVNSIANILSSSIRNIQQQINFNSIFSRLFNGIRIISQEININGVSNRLYSGIRNVFEQIFINLSVLAVKIIAFNIANVAQQIGINTVVQRIYIGLRVIYQEINLSSMGQTIAKYFIKAPQSINIANMVKRTVLSFINIPQYLSFNTMIERIRTSIINISQFFTINLMTTKVLSATRSSTQVIYISDITTKTQALFKTIPQYFSINTMVSRMRTVPRVVSSIIDMHTMSSKLIKFVRSVSQIININQMANRILAMIEKILKSLGVTMANLEINENGSIFVLLKDVGGKPVIRANCTIGMLNPDLTLWNFDNMLEFVNGTYYYNFTAPLTEGVYEVAVNCTYNKNSMYDISYFHVVPFSQITQKATTIWALTNFIGKDVRDLESATKDLPIIGDGMNALNNNLLLFGISFNQAFIIGLSCLSVIGFAIITVVLFGIDKIRSKHEEEEGEKSGYL